MNDALLVCFFEASHDLRSDVYHSFERHRAFLEHLCQLTAVDKRHRDERRVFGLADFVDGADVGVVE